MAAQRAFSRRWQAKQERRTGKSRAGKSLGGELRQERPGCFLLLASYLLY
jgi:hypothetical protein